MPALSGCSEGDKSGFCWPNRVIEWFVAKIVRERIDRPRYIELNDLQMNICCIKQTEGSLTPERLRKTKTHSLFHITTIPIKAASRI